VLRTALAALCIVLCTALSGTLPAHAEGDPVGAYNDANEQLAQLALEREALEASISVAMGAERAALERLTTTEGTLSRLVTDRRENDQRRAEIAQQIAETEAQAPALEQTAAALDRQIDAHERWLLDGDAPRARGSQAYRRALTSREQLSGDRAAVSAALSDVRESEAADVHELGRLNTEITFWEREADALSRQVGRQRGRALDANARLASVQKNGLELVETIRDQVTQLRRLGYPIGAGFAADGHAPVAPPVEWPVAAPRGYAFPIGSSSPALRASEPYRAETGAPLPTPLAQVTWTLPVRGIITTPFGDSTPYQAAHWAVDIGSRLYEPVRAAADGVVEFAGLAAGDNRLASYGMVIAIRHEASLTLCAPGRPRLRGPSAAGRRGGSGAGDRLRRADREHHRAARAFRGPA
jgi:murein DD-endopeptidase MepM/ murein hydrolase activator NlpD